jgi:peptidoglycan/xylan/chitin deacetylase (PgdA/CDA1 family)
MKKVYHARTGFLLKYLYSSLIWDFYNKTEAAFLTFDDGPTPGVTDKILDILKQHNAKATFFCQGMNVENHPGLYTRILREGHAVGNHTYSHLKGWYTANKRYYDDIDRARKFIDSDLFRPPHGKIGFFQLRHIRKSYRIIMWDIMSFDFDPDTSLQECIDNVITHAKKGSIVTFHDSAKAAEKVVASLPPVIEDLKNKGLSLSLTLSEYLQGKK